jgi:hypothetical protein
MDLTFSQAMRLGATLGEQIFGQEIGPDGSSCAFGGAILAAGIPLTPLTDPSKSSGIRRASNPSLPVSVVVLPDEWLKVVHGPAKCPECGHSGSVIEIVAHLNDAHRCSRERIADFVQGIEDNQQASARPTPELAEVCA